MAQPTQRVAGEIYEQLTGQLFELGRQLRQPNGYPFDPAGLKAHLQAGIEGRFGVITIRAKSTHEPTPSQAKALEIMGRNGHGIADVENCFGVEFTPEQRASLAQVPFSEQTLRECASTHILFPGLLMNLLDIRAKSPRSPKTFYSYENAWYNNQRFAVEQIVQVRWYLVRRDVVPGSTSKTYDEQTKLLAKNEYIPMACEKAYGVALHFLATGERLLGSICARTASLDSDGFRVSVGCFDPFGLLVFYWHVVDRLVSVGLASARKFD